MQPQRRLLVVRGFLGTVVLLACVGGTPPSSPEGTVSRLRVEKREFFTYPFRAPITHMATRRFDDEDQVVILTQNHAVILNAAKIVLKDVTFRTCADTKLAQTTSGIAVIYCPGGGFCPLCVTDLEGEELWCFESRETLLVAAYDPAGRYFACLIASGVTILEAIS